MGDTASYPWYRVVSGAHLQQGDFLINCKAPLPPLDEPPVQPEAEPGDRFERVVILTQSCDLENGKVRRVMVCPVYEIHKFLEHYDPSKHKEVKKALSRGGYHAYQLLNTCELEGQEFQHLVADFGDAFSVPIEYARELAGERQRLRMLPPYREHLAQAFARFYMRVGLPVNVNPLI
jgi:hypothetical protein